MSRRTRQAELHADVLRLLREGSELASRAERLNLDLLFLYLSDACLALGHAAMEIEQVVLKPAYRPSAQHPPDGQDELPF